MLGWPKCVHRKTRKRNSFHSRLFVEPLEDRNTPTAPTLTLSASIVANNWVQVTGQVTCDGAPTDCTVNFTGVLIDSTTPNSDGSYGVLEPIWSLGTIDAQVTDGAGQASDMAEVNLDTAAPSITLNYTYGAGGAVTLTGQVTAQTASFLTVTFGGAVNDSTQTDSDGNFSLTTNTQVTGAITAQTCDVWGQASNMASVTLTNAPPTIANFRAIAGTDNLWTFQGQVTDEYAPGLTVQLSGLSTLNGSTGSTAVTVDADGNFSITVRLQQGEGGTVTAQTFDWMGVASDTVTDVVTPTVSANSPPNGALVRA